MENYMVEREIMSFVDDLVNAGYYGYRGWWENEARADYNATGGAGKTGGGGGGSSSSGFQPLTAPDLAKLREQAYDLVKPYYEELAKQAKGDFETAVKLMTDDYSQGVRHAKETLAFENRYGVGSLNNALGSLGIDFTNENENLLDSLNKRGMAVYQNTPEGQANVVKPAEFAPSFDSSNYTSNAGVSPVQTEGLGRGGVESGRLRESQSLRAEATMRAGMKPLESAGIAFKQYSNPNTGFNAANPSATTQGIDRSQLGTAELGVLGNRISSEQGYRDKIQDLANQRSATISNLSGQVANVQGKSIDSSLANQFQKELTKDFVSGGLT